MSNSESQEEKKILRLINTVATVLDESHTTVSSASCVLIGLISITSRTLESEEERKKYLRHCIKSIEMLIDGEDDLSSAQETLIECSQCGGVCDNNDGYLYDCNGVITFVCEKCHKENEEENESQEGKTNEG